MRRHIIALTVASLLGIGHAHANPHAIGFEYLQDHETKQTDNVKQPRKNIDSTRGVGPRPGRWCGWWMRTVFGGGPEFNLARNWIKRGTNAGGPTIGAVVVWPHHVGYITGRASNGQWIVKSGNDGGRVRERARSVAGAIGFRIL